MKNEMRNELTEIVVLLDASGSMNSIRSDAVGGFNTFIEEQKAEDGRANITVTFFDSNRFHRWVDGIDLQECPALNGEYRPGAATPLLDATGRTIEDLAARLERLDDADRPGKVMVIILTDGYENCSRIFNKDRIRQMIREREEADGWEFVFLAANVDAFAEGGELGFRAQNIAAYDASPQGIREAFDLMSESAKAYRKRGIIENLGRKIVGRK